MDEQPEVEGSKPEEDGIAVQCSRCAVAMRIACETDEAPLCPTCAEAKQAAFKRAAALGFHFGF